VLSQAGRTIGRATNNQAEYKALLFGLEEVDRIADGHLEDVALVVRSDSELLCRQMCGQYRIKNRTLMSLSLKARERLGRLGSYALIYIPREENSLADRLAQRALAKARPNATFSLDEKLKS
jgi:ribonuclease HI